jgi:hypothetical protein
MRRDSSRSVKRLVLAGGLAAIVALALVVFLAPSFYEVQD